MADTSADGPMRSMLTAAGIETDDNTFDAAAAEAAAAGMSETKRAGAPDPMAPQDRFNEDGTWLNPDDSDWWEKVDVTAATVPQGKPLPITKAIKVEKTAGGALKIRSTQTSTAGGWNACMAAAKSIEEATGGGISTASLTMYANTVAAVGGTCFVPPLGGGGLR